MSTVKTIAKNTILLVAANFISLALSFIINLYIARYLAVDSYGIINAALNLGTLFAYAADLGVSTYITLELSRRPEDLRSYINNALSIKIVLATVAYVGLMATAYLAGYSGVKLLVVLIIGLFVILTAITQLFQSTFQAFQSMEYNAISQLIHPVILLLGMLYVISTGSDVVAFAMIYLVSGTVILVYNILVMAFLYARPSLQFNMGVWKVLLVGGIPFSLSVILYFLFFKIDIQLIDFMLGDTAVGYYSAAFKIIEAVMSIPAMYTVALFPIMSQYFHKKNENLSFLLEKSMKYLYLLGLPIAIGLFLLADKIIFFCYLGKYPSSIPVLQALSMGMFIIFLNAVPSSFLMASNMQKVSVYFSAVAAAINIILNIIFIPVYGIVGAAYVMVVTEAVLSLFVFYFFNKTKHRLPPMGDVVKIAACALVMAGYVYFVHDFNLALVIVSAGIIYFVLLFASGSVSRDDISLISEIFMKKKPVTPDA